MRSSEQLDRRTVREIRLSLSARRAELVRSLRSALERPALHPADRSADVGVIAAECLDEEIRVAIADRHSRQVVQVEAALEELGRGRYGVCRDCDAFIGVARLRALPSAERCLGCQARVERDREPELRAEPAWG